MNNQWRDHANCMVVWADGTYDSKRSCDEPKLCSGHGCSMPVHEDRYKEIGHTNLEEIGENSGVGYWDYMHAFEPLGGKFDSDGERVVKEYFTANPDGLAEDILRSSGVNENAHMLAQEAFDALTDKQQEVWQLVMRDQVSQTEAGRRLGISQQAVEKHLNVAKAKFTEHLREHGHARP